MRKLLLGITEDNEIVFAEAGITTRNGYKEFTASFDLVTPFENKESDGIEYFQELIDSCYDDAEKYRLCERYDCKPSELAEEMAQEEGTETLADERDCSLYDNRIYVNGLEYAFESSSCGQYDIMEDETMKEFTNEKLVQKLYTFWKAYHLKEIKNETIENEIIKTINALQIEPQEEEKIIAGYIKKYIIFVGHITKPKCTKTAAR